jgi:hypothetical protein
MRAYVRDIFSEAVEQDFLVKDPARKVTVPSQLRDTDKTTLINVGTATECAFASVVLRPSGIENVRIRDRLQRLYSALGQTKKSLGRVHLPKELADDLWLWKQECPASSPEAFIFPDAKGGFMDTGNYRRRVLHKLAKDLELPKLTFQVMLSLPLARPATLKFFIRKRTLRLLSAGRTFAPTHIIKCARNRFRDVFNTASRSDEVVEAHRILASAYFTHGEHKRALAQVDAILALKEK